MGNEYIELILSLGSVYVGFGGGGCFFWRTLVKVESTKSMCADADFSAISV